jgi:putative SOS response-associated peptidase YedK
MCGRLSLFVPDSVLEERFDATLGEPLVPRYNVAPTDDVAVVRTETPGSIDLRRWGLIPSWADDPSTNFINARAETVAEKPAFREAYASRRCLVLADGFYEWQERDRGPKQPYRVTRTDDRPFAMAGLYERWSGGDDPLETVTVITCEPNDLMADLHDRMPVVLRPDEEATWLRGDSEERAALCRSYPGDDLEAYRIGTAVNDPTNDHPGIVERDDTEQSGLGEFA